MGFLSWIVDRIVWYFGGLLLVVGQSPRCRHRLGQIDHLLRRAGHENQLADARAKYDLQPSVQFSFGTRLYGNGTIRIGEDSYLGRNCFVHAQPAAAKITIGRGCAISHSVHIRTASYRSDGDFAEALTAELEWADVKIGNYAWVGAHVYIAGGVTIGDNSIVGANSVVTEDVPPGSIYGGVPARLIRAKKGLQ